MTEYIRRQLMVKPILSVVILSFNTKELLRNCLLSLDKVAGGGNFEIIVCDNGSEDGSPEGRRREFPKIVLVENKKNLGFPRCPGRPRYPIRLARWRPGSCRRASPPGTLRESF